MTGGLFELAIVILFSAIFGIVAKLLRQPVILAYLATGALIGYFGLFHLADKETFRIFSDLGIMFLLFLVGLEINYSSLRLVGKTALIVGLGQVVFTFAIGYLIALALNFSSLSSAYIAIALTFSSTIIVVKLLSDKKDLRSLYGRISVGTMLIQDFVAIFLLIFLAGSDSGSDFLIKKAVLTVAMGVFLFAAMLWLGRKIIPLILDKIAASSELLFLLSLAWLFAVSVVMSKIGFSIEIGGLLAGLSLANSSENFQIAAKIKTLRDFFILIFFVILGASFVFSNFNSVAIPILLFSIFVLVGNPLIVLIIMGIMGFRKRTSFLVGVTVAQISEFSLILAVLGLKLGHITEETVALITAVGIITITTSTYLIIYADSIFKRISWLLSIFERGKTKEEQLFSDKNFEKPIIMMGYGRTGESIALNLEKKNLLVLDSDPEVINQLKREGIDYIFGDMRDSEIFEKMNLEKTNVIISTSPDFEDNLALLHDLGALEKKPKTILRAETEQEARLLYAKGADYVLLPNFTAGQYLGKNISVDPKMKILEQLRKKDLFLIKRLKSKTNNNKIK